MASEVNVWLSAWQATGVSPRVDQYTSNLRIEWIDDAGAARAWEGVLTFPNDLADLPVAWVKEALHDLALRAARKKLGIDP
jgi:hypothetical protein